LSGYEKKEIKADPSVGTEAIEQEKQEDMGVDSMMMVGLNVLSMISSNCLGSR